MNVHNYLNSKILKPAKEAPVVLVLVAVITVELVRSSIFKALLCCGTVEVMPPLTINALAVLTEVIDAV